MGFCCYILSQYLWESVSQKTSYLQFGDYTILFNCCSGGFGSLFPVTNLLGHCLSEAPTAASMEFLEALSDAAFPRKRRAGLPGWPGNWKQGGLCPLCPQTSAFPGVPLASAIQGASQKPASLLMGRDTLPHALGAPGQLAGAFLNYPSGPQGQSSALPPQPLGELLPHVRGNNVFICWLIEQILTACLLHARHVLGTW